MGLKKTRQDVKIQEYPDKCTTPLFLNWSFQKLMTKIYWNSVIFNISSRYNSKLDGMRMEAVLSCETCGLFP